MRSRILKPQTTPSFTLRIQFIVILLSLACTLPGYCQTPALAVIIPDETRVVNTFRDYRKLDEEYQFLSMVHLLPGEYKLPVQKESYLLEIIEKVEYGPERNAYFPQNPASMTSTSNDGETFLFEIVQEIPIEGENLEITIRFSNIRIQDDGIEPASITLDEPYLSTELYMAGRMIVGQEEEYFFYASETYESLPLYQFDVQLENGQSVQLYLRWQIPFCGSGPAALVYAVVDIEEGHVIQDNYWKLIYSAIHHNWDEKFWVLFDQPLGDAYGIAVFTRNVYNVEPREVYTLDANLQPLRTIPLIDITKSETDSLPALSGIKGFGGYE